MTVAARRQREREERRHQILDAAERLLADHGPELTMDHVASEAELGKGTLYLYFRNKEDLLVGLALRNQEAMLDAFAAASSDARSGRDLLLRLLGAYATFFGRNRTALTGFMRMFTSGCAPLDEHATGFSEHVAHKQRVFNYFLGAIERGQHDGTLRKELDPGALAVQLWAAILGGLLVDLRRDFMQRGVAIEFPQSVMPGLIALVDAATASDTEER